MPAVSIILNSCPIQSKSTKIGSVVVPDFELVKTLCFFIIEFSKVDFPTFGLPTIASFIGSFFEFNCFSLINVK